MVALVIHPRRFVVLTVVLSVLFSSGRSSAEERNLNVALFDAGPHSYQKSSGEVGGAVVDYYRAFCAYVGCSPIFHGPFPFQRALLQINAGLVDSMALLSVSKERAETLIYPRASLYEFSNFLLMREDSTLNEVNSSEDIASLSIGAEAGVNVHSWVENLDRISVSGKGDEIPYRIASMVAANRIEAGYLSSRQELQFLSRNHTALMTKLKVIKLPNSEVVFVVFSKKSKGGQWFAKQYDLYADKLDYGVFLSNQN